MIRTALAWSLALSAVACTSVEFDTRQEAEAKGVVKIEVLSVREKPERFEAEVKVTNLHDGPIVFFFKEIICFRGKEQGEMDYTNFHIGKRVMNFGRNQMRPFTWRCKLPKTKPEGDFKIALGQIYDNPSGDGTTAGKVLAKELAITIKRPAED